MGVKSGAKVIVSGDKVGEEDVFAITEKTWLTGRKNKM